MKEFFNIEPDPSSILGSMRSIGYNLSTAFADLIDNSIAAKANKIEIINADIPIENTSPNWIAILDNGVGMNTEKMLNAFTLGGKGINAVRSPEDLGRYGLGLKTASFSQCAKLTLISKICDDNNIYSLQFDLNYIEEHKKWEVFSLNESKIHEIIEKCKSRVSDLDFFNAKSWTIVFWEDLDRMINAQKNYYFSELEKVKEHLSLVFHKFQSKLNISLNKTVIEFWNPFYGALSSEIKKLKFSNNPNDFFEVKTHLLNHQSYFDNKTQYDYQFKNGTAFSLQGFYVYRNNRLIFVGGWLNLFKSEYQNIFGRIEINLSSSLESDKCWEVNISKSQVKIPNYAFNELYTIAKALSFESFNIFRYHGGIKRHNVSKKRKAINYTPFWLTENIGNNNGSVDYYRINKKHPIIEQFLNNLTKEKEEEFKNVLKIIENCLPIDNIVARRANGEVEQEPIDLNLLQMVYENQLSIMVNAGVDQEDAEKTLLSIEPFIHLKN